MFALGLLAGGASSVTLGVTAASLSHGTFVTWHPPPHPAHGSDHPATLPCAMNVEFSAIEVPGEANPLTEGILFHVLRSAASRGSPAGSDGYEAAAGMGKGSRLLSSATGLSEP